MVPLSYPLIATQCLLIRYDPIHSRSASLTFDWIVISFTSIYAQRLHVLCHGTITSSGHKRAGSSRFEHHSPLPRFQVPLLVTPLFSRCTSPPPLRWWCSPSLWGQFPSRTPYAVYFPSLCQSARHPLTLMGLLMSKTCKLASIILSSLYSLFSF